MEQSIKEKLSKIYELVNNGATDGERASAKAALQRMLDKYNITDEQLDSINISQYIFKYTSENDMLLIGALQRILLNKRVPGFRRKLKFNESRTALVKCKEIVLELTYQEWVIMDCSYAYFKKHMSGQYRKVVTPMVKKLNKNKLNRSATKQRIKKLQADFFETYLIKSKLTRPEDLIRVDLKGKELKRAMQLDAVEGGDYKTQVQTQKQSLLTI